MHFAMGTENPSEKYSSVTTVITITDSSPDSSTSTGVKRMTNGDIGEESV